VPDPPVRRLHAVLDAPLTRLEQSRDELAKAWLLRVLERAPLSDIERIPTERIVRELPDLISDIVRAVARSAAGSPVDLLTADAEERASRLASLSGRDAHAPADLARDIAALHSVMIAALGRELQDEEARVLVDAAERFATVFGAIQAAAAEELVRERSRELEWLANTDALTGLYNLRYLQQHIRHLVGIQERYGHSFAALVLDINGLKRINDAHGHAAGDRMLMGVAAAIRATVRTIDTPVRMGGDEFCVLAPHQTASGGKILAYRLGASVEQIETPDKSAVGVSIGVVACPHHGTDPDRLLELADAAMYRAKASGERVEVGSVEGEDAETGDARGERNSK
jgi:diguanylate cyclase (GGDEF)-like protein